jgi:hypothetical protein
MAAYDSYNERWGSGYAGAGRKPKAKPKRAKPSRPQDVTIASLSDAVAELTTGTGVHAQADQAISETLELVGAYELERGHRPGPYATQQRGLEDDFETFVRERRERERAARDAEHEALERVRHEERLAGEREMRERRAEMAAFLYADRLLSS